MNKIIIIGPGYPLRGGLATFDHRLAKEFLDCGYECSIISFSLQYPRIFFPGKSQQTKEPAPEGIRIRTEINSINPFNWIGVGNRIRNEKPDLVIARFWIPFMGLSVGSILRRVKKNGHTKIICLADNIIPHEHRPGDRKLTHYFMKPCDAFITMSDTVMDELKEFEKDKPSSMIPHPLYDSFGDPVEKTLAREKLGLPANEKIILFFGFIRYYKGLDILLRSMADKRIRKAGVRLLIAGEYYDDSKKYETLIAELGIGDQLILKTDFIPDSEVRYYLCSADLVVQPYRTASQSGVTPLAYHFEKPMVVTDVGGLASMVPHEQVGLVADPDPGSVAEAILRFYQLGEDYFIPHLRVEKKKFSWGNFVHAVTDLADRIQSDNQR